MSGMKGILQFLEYGQLIINGQKDKTLCCKCQGGLRCRVSEAVCGIAIIDYKEGRRKLYELRRYLLWLRKYPERFIECVFGSRERIVYLLQLSDYNGGDGKSGVLLKANSMKLTKVSKRGEKKRKKRGRGGIEKQ